MFFNWSCNWRCNICNNFLWLINGNWLFTYVFNLFHIFLSFDFILLYNCGCCWLLNWNLVFYLCFFRRFWFWFIFLLLLILFIFFLFIFFLFLILDFLYFINIIIFYWLLNYRLRFLNVRLFSFNEYLYILYTNTFLKFN